MSPIKYANDHPWIYVVLAFLLLITAWTTFIILAVKNRKPPLEESRTTHSIHLEIVSPGNAEPQFGIATQAHLNRQQRYQS